MPAPAKTEISRISLGADEPVRQRINRAGDKNYQAIDKAESFQTVCNISLRNFSSWRSRLEHALRVIFVCRRFTDREDMHASFLLTRRGYTVMDVRQHSYGRRIPVA